MSKEKLFRIDAQLQDGRITEIYCGLCGNKTFRKVAHGWQCPKCLVYSSPKEGITFIAQEIENGSNGQARP